MSHVHLHFLLHCQYNTYATFTFNIVLCVCVFFLTVYFQSDFEVWEKFEPYLDWASVGTWHPQRTIGTLPSA